MKSHRTLTPVAMLGLTGAALVPKCPFCLAAWLCAFGAGASTATGAAPILVAAAYGAMAVSTAVVAVRLARRRF